MAEVKWIKITTNIFDNKKIKKIRRMPEGNNIVLIWVYLLTKAGESNKHGGIYYTDSIPYSLQDISDDADFKIDIVKLAIGVLERWQMIEIFEDVLYIKNWEEYQNIEGLDKIREQGKLRQQKFRDKQKLLPDSNVTVTLCNATEEDKELELELEIELELELEIDKDIKIKDIELFFEDIWKLYPIKKGKASISKSKKKELHKLGQDVLMKCIKRYTLYVEEVNKKPNSNLQYKNGSTFFNSGYVDYLDENYEELKDNNGVEGNGATKKENESNNPYANIDFNDY